MIEQFDKFLRSHTDALLADAEVRSRLAAVPCDRAVAPDERSRAEMILELMAVDARTTLRLIDGHLRPRERVLEVGGGVGLTHLYLRHAGHDIVSIEPSAAGHASYYDIGKAILRVVGADMSQWIPMTADAVPTLGRSFDLIFSNNVLEHISDLEPAFDALASCLAPGGRMRHNCANYLVPYEPHFVMPLVPVYHRLTERLRPSLVNDELWEGLNFVTSLQMIRLARKHKLEVAFDRNHLYETFMRLGHDPAFGGKHAGLQTIYRILKATGMIHALRWIPPVLATPMQLTLVKPAFASVS